MGRKLKKPFSKKAIFILLITISAAITTPLIGYVVFQNQLKKKSPGYIGVTLGFTPRVRFGGSYENRDNPIFNVPMYLPTENQSQFWDNIVEQLDYAEVDFVAPTIRGHIAGEIQMNAPGDPRLLSGLVDAIYRRGIQDKLKISCLDDIPASWTAVKNQEKYNSYSYSPEPFDLADVDGTGEGGYRYVWDQNLRDFFETVPNDIRFKIDDRPVIYNWGVGDYAFSNYEGSAAVNLIKYIKSQCQDEFGFDPYIIADRTWLTNVNDKNIEEYLDGVHAWFGVGGNNPGWTNYRWKNRWYGVCVPEFRFVSENEGTYMEIKPDHGKKFEEVLQQTVGDGAYVTLVEGFTDYSENAALWRAKDGSYSETHYDYSNQRLNILRSYSRNAYPDIFRLEAEACDYYNDLTAGNDGDSYRDGDLDISNSTYEAGGRTRWYVTNTEAREWLEWREILMEKSVNIEICCSTNSSGGQIKIQIGDDEDNLSEIVDIPITGGYSTWDIITLGVFEFGKKISASIKISILSGNPDIDYIKINQF